MSAALNQIAGTVIAKAHPRLGRQPIPKSSMRSSGVPHVRQITAWQSPQTSGSETGAAHAGQ